jgi:hypothetical protein
MSWLVRLLLVLVACLLLMLMSAGGYQMWSQWHRLRTFLPAEAVVDWTDVKTQISQGKHTHYTFLPRVARRYSVNGRAYGSSEVLPLADHYTGDGLWARQIVSRYHPGDRVTTYYNPAEPSESFLLPELLYEPLLMIQFPMLFLLVGSGIVLLTGFIRPRAQAPQPQPDGTFRLRTGHSVAYRRDLCALFTAAWWAVGLLTSGWYFLYAAAPYPALALIATDVYAGIGLVPLCMAIYYTQVRLELDEPLVSTDRDKFVSGGEVNVLLEQRARSALTIDTAELALICTALTKTTSGNKTSYSSEKYYQKRQTVFSSHRLTPGEPISAVQAFTIPAHPATSPPGYKGYPRYDWAIEVHVKVHGHPGYRGTFPVTVEPAGAGVTVSPGLPAS